MHILSSTRHIRLENAGSPGEIGLIGLLDDGQLDIWAHGDNSTDIITFRTGSSTGTERVRIDNAGKVMEQLFECLFLNLEDPKHDLLNF